MTKKGLFWGTAIFILALVIGILSTSRQHTSPIPPPESPLVPVDDAPIDAALMIGYGDFEIWWDDPTVPVGFETVHCANLDAAHFHFDWRLKDADGTVVHDATIEFSEDAPRTPGSGVFAGPATIEADLGEAPPTVTVWVRPRWDLAGALCVDLDGQEIYEVIGIHVPPAGQSTYEDVDGFWLASTAEGYELIYTPYIIKNAP